MKKKYSIVIVENDEDEQFFMKEGFDATGLFNIVAQLRNGDELMDWLGKQASTSLPDVILSDLNMPGKNGYDILDEVRADTRYDRLPVIITSTSSTKQTIEKCMGKGAAAYVVKPETFIMYAPYVEDLHKLLEQKNMVR